LKILLSVVIALSFSGCFDSNPLIGKWRATKKVMMIRNIEFTKDKAIASGMFEEVEYDVQDNQVLVTDQMGIGSIYKIIDNNTISVQVPMMGTLIYKRVE